MTKFAFWKMHATGNDFVVTESEHADAGWGSLAEQVCDRHLGVGADGLIVMLPSTVADRRMRIFNPDGSEAEMCGNGIRCVVTYALERGLVPAGENGSTGAEPSATTMTVETIPGVIEARARLGADGHVDRVRVSMGTPALRPQDLGARIEQEPPVLDLPLEAAGESLRVTLVSMGNPHAVQFLDRPTAQYELERVGPAVEHHPLFAHRTNFEVVRVLDRSHIEMRVWERGVGETLSCGSGASAAVVAARLHGLVDDTVEVRVPGGTLEIEWDGAGAVYLEGPATRVFAAEWEGVAL